MASINIKQETRLCTVNGEPGYFHCWEHYSKPIEPSSFIGGAPAGIFSEVFGIIEFADRVERVDPTNIKFCDEENAILNDMVKYMKGRKND